MSFFALHVKFSSALCIPASGGHNLSTPMSIGAERLFSALALAWTSIFGADDFESRVIKPFLAGNPPWIHSDLLPAQDDNVFVPAIAGALEQDLVSSFQSSWYSLEQLVETFRVPENRSAKLNSVLSQISSRHDLLESGQMIRIRREDAAPHRLHRKVFAQVQAVNKDLDEGKELSYIAFFSIPSSESSGRSISSDSLIENDLSVEESLRVAIAYLKDEGLGAMRSSGAGKISEITLTRVENRFESLFGSNHEAISASAQPEKRYIILSSCCPTESMIDAVENSSLVSNSFRISRSSGWIFDSDGQSTNCKKPHVSQFETGSIFSLPPEGRFLDISRSGHPCFRYGIAFVVSL